MTIKSLEKTAQLSLSEWGFIYSPLLLYILLFFFYFFMTKKKGKRINKRYIGKREIRGFDSHWSGLMPDFAVLCSVAGIFPIVSRDAWRRLAVGFPARPERSRGKLFITEFFGGFGTSIWRYRPKVWGVPPLHHRGRQPPVCKVVACATILRGQAVRGGKPFIAGFRGGITYGGSGADWSGRDVRRIVGRAKYA
jgi:hypothetical protein